MIVRQGIVVAAALALAWPAAAQEVCDTLARNLRQDVLIQGSAASQLASHQSVICRDEYRDWGTASRRSFNGSLNVPGYVDAVMGSRSSAGSWETTREQFCRLDSAFVTASASAASKVRRASAVAYDAIVRCAQVYADGSRYGLFGVLKVNDRRDGFTIDVLYRTGGPNALAFTGVHATPTTPGFTCREKLHEASEAAPVRLERGSTVIVCDKNPNVPIQVAVNTAQGPAGTYQIAALDDELAEMRARGAAIEAAALPSGTVVWTEKACPAGWQTYEKALGRTIVGAGNHENQNERGQRIKKWEVSETGGAENHVLTLEEMPNHTHGTYISMSRLGTGRYAQLGESGSDRIERRGTTDDAGGGKPHNNMPPFVALTPCIRP